MSDQRFNTGNPIGSNSPLDRSDNTRNLDLAVNSSDAEWSDRLGRERKSFEGLEREFDAAQVYRENEFDSAQYSREARFNDFISSSGYQFLGDYAAGLEFTEYNQLVRDENGEFWRVSGQVDLPYVTTGAGIPEDNALVPAGDAVLRQDLADPDKGAAMVARGVVAVDSIADLLALPEGQRKEGLRYLVQGYHAGSDVGGGELYWDAASTATHNGGTVFAVAGVDVGRFVRRFDGAVNVTWFGATGDGVTDDAAAVQAAVDASGGNIDFGAGGLFRISSPVGLPTNSLYSAKTLRITGSGATILVDSEEAIFTSQRSLANPDSTDDLYTGKINVTGLNFKPYGSDPVVIFNGDRLYNLMCYRNNFQGTQLTVVKSFRNKGAGYPTGYIQSVILDSNHFASVDRIIDAKRGFNIVFNNNHCENCIRGIYIDGTGDPAVNNLRMCDNLWESGGVFLKLGACYAYKISGNYFEGNGIGDVPSLKCVIHMVKTTGGFSSGGEISANGFQATSWQRTDADYRDIKYSGTSDYPGSPVKPPVVFGNWTNSYSLITPGAAKCFFGNGGSGATSAKTSTPGFHQDANVSFTTSSRYFNLSEHRDGDIVTVAEVDVSGLRDSFPTLTAELNLHIQALSSGSVVLGSCVVKVLLVAQGAEGFGPGAGPVATRYLGATLVSFAEIPTGSVVGTIYNTRILKHFTDSELTVVDAGSNRYKLRLSGFSTPSQTNFGSATQLAVNGTMTVYGKTRVGGSYLGGIVLI